MTGHRAVVTTAIDAPMITRPDHVAAPGAADWHTTSPRSAWNAWCKTCDRRIVLVWRADRVHWRHVLGGQVRPSNDPPDARSAESSARRR